MILSLDRQRAMNLLSKLVLPRVLIHSRELLNMKFMLPMARHSLGHPTFRSLILDPYDTEIRDFLLQEVDFPPHNKLFLTKTTWQQFDQKFGAFLRVVRKYNNNNLWRLTVVLPLFVGVSNKTVVVIPFIVDTGAPCHFYLGTGAIRALKSINLITEVLGPNGEVGRLVGSLRYREKVLDTPLVMNTPKIYEMIGGMHGDVRVNIVGLPVIDHFELCICK